jgi:Putative redox-active protein (C_GCAxxG_C_C)
MSFSTARLGGGGKMKIKRREMMFVGLGALAGMISYHFRSRVSHAGPGLDQVLNWKQPRKIDLGQAAHMAYDGYKERGLGCCHGVFKGLVSPMIAEMGAPYNTFPVDIMRAGKSGVADSGSLCGSLLGAAYAFHLFFEPKIADEMQKEMHRWYGQTLLPKYVPGVSNFKDYEVPKTKAILPECHASIDVWIKATGFSKETDERRERCGRLTADVAIKAAKIWNAQIDGQPIAMTPMSDNQMYCGKCHIKGVAPTKGEPDFNDGKYLREVGTNMSCPSCHPGRRRNHPKTMPAHIKKKV